jgi:hypothetical protein
MILSCPITLKPEVAAAIINWYEGDALRQLAKAVKVWDDKTGEAVDENDEAISLQQFTCVIDIPHSTLKNYVCEDLEQHRRLGVIRSHQPLLAQRDQEFIRNVMARKDRANKGANMQDSVDLIQNLVPGLSNMQAHKHLT